ncbi:MAG: ZIP family metal transporter [Chitinophagales bacterium]|nr:ZIP family metal transporter [Chitinophagales bacterium]
MKTWELLLLTGAPISGGIIAFFLKTKNKNDYKLVLSFSGAFLFSITVIHLFPLIFKNGESAGLYVLLGFFIQIFLEQLTHGIEHGHFHEHSENNSYILAVLTGLTLHSFLDGIPLANAGMLQSSHTSLLYGISLHKIPEGFALTSILLFSFLKKPQILIILFLFSLAAPSAVLIADHFINSRFFFVLIAMASGSLLHVSTTILFESESGSHFFGWKKITAIILGVGLSLLTA